MEAVVEKAVREVEDFDPLAPESRVERLVVRIEARDRNRHQRVIHADLVGVDDGLRRHGYQEELDAAARELSMESDDRRERVEAGRLLCGAGAGAREGASGEVAQLGGKEEPALSSRYGDGGPRFRLGRERGVGRAEIVREVVRNAGPARSREQEAGQGERRPGPPDALPARCRPPVRIPRANPPRAARFGHCCHLRPECRCSIMARCIC